METTERNERPATVEEREYVNRALFNYGLYSAALDTYDVPEHPEDEKWIIQGNN